MFIVHIKKALPDFLLDISFSIENNILVLFGPSGCGKTTLLRCIAGLAAIDEGEISLGNRCFFFYKRKHLYSATKAKNWFCLSRLCLISSL